MWKDWVNSMGEKQFRNNKQSSLAGGGGQFPNGVSQAEQARKLRQKYRCITAVLVGVIVVAFGSLLMKAIFPQQPEQPAQLERRDERPETPASQPQSPPSAPAPTPTNPPTEIPTQPPTSPAQILSRPASVWDFHANEALPDFMWDRTDAVYDIQAGDSHTVALYMNGTVKAVGSNYSGQCNVEHWDDVIQISTLMDVTLGLRLDGTVYATGDNRYGACNVGSWTDIVHVGAGCYHSVGLRSDGTVVATGSNDYGQCNVDSWRDIQKVYASAEHTLGLKDDGTVIITGYYTNGITKTVIGWNDIVDICVSRTHFLGLTRKGHVVSTGDNDLHQCEVGSWSNIRSISAGEGFSVAVNTRGNVLFVGEPGDNGLDTVDDWGGIWAVACGTQHIVCTTEGGSLWLCGADSDGNYNVDPLNPLFSYRY